MKTMRWPLPLLLVVLTLIPFFTAKAETGFEVAEYLGHNWVEDNVHRHIEIRKGGVLFPDKVALFLQDGNVAREVAAQLTNVQKHEDGSLQSADIVFRSDLPANSNRRFSLRSQAPAAPTTSLKVRGTENGFEVSNDLTAVRVPQLSVRLPSGVWTGGVQITPPEGETLRQNTEILEQGPLFVTVRTMYQTSGGGRYQCDVSLREGDPLVRIQEKFEKAGRFKMDLSTGFKPSKFTTKKGFRGDTQLTDLDYGTDGEVIKFTGWDFFESTYTSVLGLLNDQDILGMMSTSPTGWEPEPFWRPLRLHIKDGRLQVEQTLYGGNGDSDKPGRRAWALLPARAGDFKDPGRDLYRYWNQHVIVPLDKVANWQLAWPEMEKIEFPHMFFSKAEMPAIRARLQADSTIKEYMEGLRRNNTVAGIASLLPNSSPEQKEKLQEYRAKYENRGGIGKGITYIGAAALYFGDPVYDEQLNDKTGLEWESTPEGYLDYFIKCYLEGAGIMTPNMAMYNMQVSDALLQRYVGLELLLGSDLLTTAEKRKLLSKLAFVTYVMHEPEWQPPLHLPDGTKAGGYSQGTPNQRHCAFSARAITACMLENHPMKPTWMDFAMKEVRIHYPQTIAESGALLESPFYTSRDTMRYGPFWSAMTRAGVAEIAPDYKQWMNRPKKAFVYLADMLTPKEPRMGGRRVYHPIGRSSSGVVDPTFMIGADPWGLDDPQFTSLMRWAWEQQGKPSPDVMGTTGGRDLSLTLIAFSRSTNAKPPDQCPLESKRYAGMGAILRSQGCTDYESNVLWRHDRFAWDLYDVNNGGVYFYGKGAPLLPRFGAYWGGDTNGNNMMSLPFGNRLEFASGDNSSLGSSTDFASLGNLADIVEGVSGDNHWQRRVLLSKDLDRDDPIYLLVRDDVARPGVASSVNWWIMSKNVQPDGTDKPGVVPIKLSSGEWTSNMGHNWKEAPKLTGPLHHFPGLTGVDLDMFIATPADPQILTDAASTGKMPYNVAGFDMVETQQLVRISQPAGQGYLTLFVPRWPGSAQPNYRMIAQGKGVAVDGPAGQDRLFLADEVLSYKDDIAEFNGSAGFVRKGKDSLRLMVEGGRVAAGGITLTTRDKACLLFADGKIQVFTSGDKNAAQVTLSDALKATPVAVEKTP